MAFYSKKTAASVDRIYSRQHINLGKDKCSYCDELAQITNRVIPAELAGMMSTSDREEFADGLKIVPSCRSCASAAQHLLFANVGEKMDYIGAHFTIRKTEDQKKLMNKIELRTHEFVRDRRV